VKFFLFWVRTINKSVGKKAHLPFPLDVQKLKGFQLQGGFAPWPSDQGLCPWTRPPL